MLVCWPVLTHVVFQDNLDVYDKYSENPSQLPFLAKVVRNVVLHHSQVDFQVEPLLASAPR